MAIVSVNRVLTTQDRTVLEWEYENIINRLAIGNVEGDAEMKRLYDELLNFINGKGLRAEDMRRLREGQKHREQEAYYRAMSHGFDNLQAPQNDSLWGWIGGLVVSGVSSVGAGYYDYQASKEQIHREIGNDAWRLRKEELEACNKLQATLLNSSWSLLSKYHLPNDYRLTQENVREFLSAMDEADPSIRLGRLKFIERKFRVYPPYWFLRADAAMKAGNYEECRKCFARFNEVWRPVLNYDPYKLEATKYRICELGKNGVLSGEGLNEIRGLVEIVRDYTPPLDWGSNLFAGIVYFALGDKDEAVTCVEYGNVKPGRETEISGAVLAFMKGHVDLSSLPPKAVGLYQNMLRILPREELVKEAESGNTVALSVLNEQGYARYGDAQYRLGLMYELGLGARQDYSEAVKWYRLAAERGYAPAQHRLGYIYENGYGVSKDIHKALKLYQKAAKQGDTYAQKALERLN